jgi:class 3 adenylate cyclase
MQMKSALALLRTLRVEVVDPLVLARGGRVFKRTGDGVIVEFISAVSAVRSAPSLIGQSEQSAGRPTRRSLEFRFDGG